MWLLCVALFLAAAHCSLYKPAAFDVLEPPPDAQIIAFTEDGNVIVTPGFVYWVDELKSEIIRLRKECK